MRLLQILKLIFEGAFGTKVTSHPKPAKTPASTTPPDVAPDTDEGEDIPKIGLEIVRVESAPGDRTRRDANDHLKVYGLPEGDGGGSWEIAGLNSFHPEIRMELRSMPPEHRELIAAKYIENYTRKGTGLNEPTGLRSGTLLFVLDTAFNRGPGGCAWIVQDTLIRLGHPLLRDRTWGPKTRAALREEDQKGRKAIITELRASRERYEVQIVIPRHPKGTRDKFWQGLVNRWDKIATLAYQWNGKEPVSPETPIKRKPPTARPDTITLPRESTSGLNAFYGRANKAGSYNEWFSFPVDDVVLYKRGGTPLKDRDKDGRDDHRCHGAIVDDLEAALQEIYDTLGKERFYKEGWHVYGGCFNYRYKTSGSSLSTHSWAIAVDINPAENGWKHYGTSFSDESLDIMEKYGFLNAGRAWGHDYMHFQKAIPRVSKGTYYDRNGLPSHIKQA